MAGIFDAREKVIDRIMEYGTGIERDLLYASVMVKKFQGSIGYGSGIG